MAQTVLQIEKKLAELEEKKDPAEKFIPKLNTQNEVVRRTLYAYLIYQFSNA